MKEHQALISCVAAALTALGAGFAFLGNFRPARPTPVVLVQPDQADPEAVPGAGGAQPPSSGSDGPRRDTTSAPKPSAQAQPPETTPAPKPSTQPPPKPAGEEGVQVLTRGPVHEAFAEAVTFDPEPGVVVVEEAPPDAVGEAPPDQRPDGDDVVWIPGYAAWDDERSDFLWVSGVWRSPPPARQWVSGYWGRCGSGFQWTSGYWAEAAAVEVEYLPEPPEAVESGPVGHPPSADHVWIPGLWVWRDGRYAWRPGYWVAAQADWDWVPCHYVWAPRGYVFVDGYWDYPAERRGVLFAPVYIDAAARVRVGFSYSPSIVIVAAAFADHLFVRPACGSYYFGDYYDARYAAAGFYWACTYGATRRGYDPVYARLRWKHRMDSGWEARVEADFRNRRDHAEARPPRTLAAQVALGVDGRLEGGAGGLVVAARLDKLAKGGDGPVRLRAVDAAEKQKLARRVEEVRKFREERRALEAPAKSPPPKASGPDRVRLPKPAAAAKPADVGKGQTPPRRHEAPAPDPKVEAKPRGQRGKATPRPEPREKPQPKAGPGRDKAVPRPEPREKPGTEPKGKSRWPVP